MSVDDDSALDEEVEVEETLEDGFGEVEFEEIKVGFEEENKEEESSKDLSEEELEDLLKLGFLAEVLGVDHLLGLSLEESLSDVFGSNKLPNDDYSLERENLEANDFYKTKISVGDFYENDLYAVSFGSENGEADARPGYEGFVEIDDVNTLVVPEAGRQSDRSVLEISGFRDDEAEKKRREKRERFW